MKLGTIHAMTLTMLLGTALAAGGCSGGDDAESGDENAAVDEAAIPESLFVDAALPGAKNVGELKESAKEGDQVVVTGRVGGSAEPFVEGRAMLTLAGDTDEITACSDRPDDACPTPWDFCCDDPKAILHHTATIQVLGPDGRPLKAGLEGRHGLAKLGRITVAGTVGPRPSDEVLVVNATAIHVK